MNIYRFKPLKIPTALCSLVLSALLLNACGGGSVASVILSGIGGTGIVFGPITAFGSVYVNGNKFEIIDSEFDVDGNTGADQSNLRLGMVVKLEVETENGVYTGKALKVSYDDEIQGPVEAAPVLNADGTKNLTVLGQTIIVDEIGTVFDGTDFDTIAQGDIIEVSGFRTPTAIEATFLEKKSPTTPEVELRGNIAGFTTGGTTFQIGIVTINFVPGTTDIDVPGGIDNGKYVEIEGVL
ncbi:MAG: DUF5666 domain-containing protein, partial [Gammaproteobacteria bacterium]|nr:DUF5666 domain-containing protein [Gammaproteobacteria bacterium]